MKTYTRPTIAQLLKKALPIVRKDECKGICKACGKINPNCEPDARNYTCSRCGQNEVFGAEEILLTYGGM